MPLRLRKNDMVMIVSGDSRGQTGKIIKMVHKKNRAVVEAKNIVKRHTKQGRKVQQGGIIEKEASIHLSNLHQFPVPFSVTTFLQSCGLPTPVERPARTGVDGATREDALHLASASH